MAFDPIYIFWVQSSKSGYNILLKKSTDGGQTFGPATAISNIGSNIQINIDSQNNVYVDGEQNLKMMKYL